MKKGSILTTLLITSLFLFSNLTYSIEQEGVQLIKNAEGYLVNFTLPQYEMNSIFAEGEEYINLTVPGYGVTPGTGLPALPLISFNLFLSYQEEQPAFNVLNLNMEEKDLSKKIYPFQMPWEKNHPREERPFTIDSDYYNSRGNINAQFVSFSEPFILGGVKGMIVTIYPFRYNPSEDKLVVINSGSFQIKLNYPVTPGEGKSEVFNQFLDNAFVNYDGVTDETLIKYLIITAPQFEGGMTQFVNHKTTKGFDVDMFNTDVTGVTTSGIKSFIQNRYNNPETRPEFILLVGDVGHIPAWTGSGAGSPKTDLNYVQLEGADYFADAFIGRFSVSTTGELQNAIDKSMFMENYIATLDKKNIFMASTDNWQISEGTHNYVIDNYFDPAGYTNLKLYTNTYNATTQQLINALNDNQLFAVYSGHGGTYSWADGPPLSQAQVRALTNTWYPFVFSFACVTGSYHVTECFGETWLRTENGASIFIGSSVNSYWDEDDILEKKIFYAMFEEDLTRVTPMFLQGMIHLVNHYGGVNGTMLRYMEMYNLMGDPSMPLVRQIPPDTTPPEPVIDLVAVNPASNAITLNWTAPFDSTFGGIATYDIRFSTSMINNNDDFNNASQRLLAGQSDSAGTLKSFIVDGLDFSTTYYFAIKAKDIWDNTSGMSNVPSLATFGAPEIALSCDSLHCLVLPNSIYTDSIVISNVSAHNSTLDYSIELMNNNFPVNVYLQLIGLNQFAERSLNGSKENQEKSPGLHFKGSGGPDLFGYEWIDSNEPDGPDFVWNDISIDPDAVQITNWQGNPDDGYTGAIPFGFEFDFYGVSFSELYISTNGFISFVPIGHGYYYNDPIPRSDGPNSIICPFWDDLDGSNQGSVHYLLEPGKFTVQYTDWQRYPTTGSLTFQVVLHSNNKIYFYYENLVGALNSNTVGIENQNGTDGLEVAYNSPYVENNLAVLFCDEPEWLTLNHYGGTLYNGLSAAIILNIETGDLEPGEYSMDVAITSNDPNNTEIIVPVRMTVTNIVPVELAHFTAEKNSDKVLLKWQTATETNNSGFEVERTWKSEDSNQNEWKKITFVEGNGTTTETTNYSFSDKITEPGIYNYRLKQIDYDGTVNYSQVIEIDITGPVDYLLYQNYPNPFNPATTIRFALPVKTDLVVAVYNVIGEKVAEAFKGELEEGYHEVHFDASNLSSGVYIYRLESEQFVDVKKMILLR